METNGTTANGAATAMRAWTVGELREALAAYESGNNRGRAGPDHLC